VRLELNRIAKAYRDGASTRQVLADLDASFEAGGLTAVTGPSGIGKSTLLAIAGGMTKPDTGTVRFISAGERRTPIGYRNVSWIFQTNNLLHNRSALDNVAIALMSVGSSRQAAEYRGHIALEDVDLGDISNTLVSKLSGGERQRVAVARALVRPGSVILADEPTAQLDRSNASAIGKSLVVAAKNHIVVVASHDPVISDYAATVLYLRNGRLWAGG